MKRYEIEYQIAYTAVSKDNAPVILSQRVITRVLATDFMDALTVVVEGLKQNKDCIFEVTSVKTVTS